MNLRELSQWANLTLNLIVFFSAIVGLWLKPEKRFSLLPWLLYGLIGVGFYIPVLVFRNGVFGNDYSSFRNLVQDAIVASSLFWLSFGDIWKRLKK